MKATFEQVGRIDRKEDELRLRDLKKGDWFLWKDNPQFQYPKLVLQDVFAYTEEGNQRWIAEYDDWLVILIQVHLQYKVI